ncbi:hypothetical protein Y032_0155g3083 [Ancylostoma ceylanicum]|nr:hypothetical protein Y032_0155g3083 [Ancylostoma ceylanicum]
MGVTLKDKVLNEVVRSTFGVAPIADKMREARLHWFGHVCRREEDSVAKTALNLNVEGTRPRGRPKTRWLDCVKSDMAESYLQSLEKATKALRQSQPAEEKRPTGGHHSLLESSRLSSERGSLSSMISQLRNRTQRESTIDESDGDQSMSDHQSQNSGETPSIDSQSSAGGERIVFDFPYEAVKEDNRRSDPLPKELPADNQSARAAVPPLVYDRSEFTVSTLNPYNAYSVTSKPNVSKAKSPFRPAIESGSDLESIDFEEATSPTKSVHFEDQAKSTTSTNSTSSRSSRSSSSSSSQSKSKSSSSSSRSTSRSKSTSESSSSESSTIKGELSDHSTDSSTRQPSPSSTRQLEEGKILDDSSRNSRAGMKRQQKTEDSYCSSGETSPSAGKDKARAQESSTNPRRRSKSRSRSASLTPPKPEIPDSTTNLLHQKSVEQQKTSTVHEKEFASRKSTSSSVSAAGTTHGGAVERPPSALPRAATYATLTEHSTQTEARKEPDSLPGE